MGFRFDIFYFCWVERWIVDRGICGISVVDVLLHFCCFVFRVVHVLFGHVMENVELVICIMHVFCKDCSIVVFDFVLVELVFLCYLGFVE